MVYLSVALWGVAFGGFATLTQTALSRLSGRAADVAQSMYTTGWNTAVAAGGAIGGMLLDKGGAASLLGHHRAPHPVFNRHAVCHESGAGLSAMR